MTSPAYLWNRFMKKIRGTAKENTVFAPGSRVEAGSTLINTVFGPYSYAGYDCWLINCEIGKYCSIGDYVVIGIGGEHPLNWVSTSPAFYLGSDHVSRNLAALDYQQKNLTTRIGNDVWIGRNCTLKAGITVGNGAVLGAGSMVTKDVPPYSIAAGNPARIIRYRFDPETNERLNASAWWDLPEEDLVKLTKYMDDVKTFLAEAERMRGGKKT